MVPKYKQVKPNHKYKSVRGKMLRNTVSGFYSKKLQVGEKFKFTATYCKIF